MEITKGRLQELQDTELKMRALEAGGVDNWEFYDDSLESFHKELEKREKINNLFDEIVEELCEGVEEPAGQGAGFGVKAENIENAKRIFDKLKFDIK